MFLDNRYAAIYYRIIDMAANQKHIGYTEVHHIIPRCLGGNNVQDNLVRVTPKQHFVLHHLLTKMVSDPIKLRKLGRAWRMMCTASKDTPGRRTATRYHIERCSFIISRGKMSEEERLRRSATFKKKHAEDKEWAARRAESIRATMATPEYRAKVKLERMQRSNNPEYLAKLSEGNRRRYMRDEERVATSAAIRKVRSTSESRQKTSKASLDMWKNPEHRAKISAAMKRAWEKRRTEKL